MIIKPLITVNVDPATREERLKALLAGRPPASSSNDANSTVGTIAAGDTRARNRYFYKDLPVLRRHSPE